MSEQEQQYYRNLLDAGFAPRSAERCIALLQNGKTAELLRGLTDYRRKLLERLHADQRQIDCLDYFVFQIAKTV